MHRKPVLCVLGIHRKLHRRIYGIETIKYSQLSSSSSSSRSPFFKCLNKRAHTLTIHFFLLFRCSHRLSFSYWLKQYTLIWLSYVCRLNSNWVASCIGTDYRCWWRMQKKKQRICLNTYYIWKKSHVFLLLLLCVSAVICMYNRRRATQQPQQQQHKSFSFEVALFCRAQWNRCMCAYSVLYWCILNTDKQRPTSKMQEANSSARKDRKSEKRAVKCDLWWFGSSNILTWH